MSVSPSLLLLGSLLAFDVEPALENTNIFTYDRLTRAVDYNRLRLETTFNHMKYENLFAKVLIDNQTIGRTGDDGLANRTEIYRGYLEYAGLKHLVVLGRQRVPFGVGRVWNPIDVFNPIDSLSIEPDERPGTEALHYEYAVNPLTNFDMTVSREKSAARIKGYLDIADLALVGVMDRDNDVDIIGYEAEGELLDTNIALRSEGGSFYDRRSGERHTEFIVGADYGFVNSLTLLGEYRYNDETKMDYFGTIISYQPGPLVTLQLLTIVNLDDESFVTSPSLDYSVSDEMTLATGLFIYSGSDTDTLGAWEDSFFLRLYAHF